MAVATENSWVSGFCDFLKTLWLCGDRNARRPPPADGWRTRQLAALHNRVVVI